MIAKRFALLVVVLILGFAFPVHAQDRTGWGVSAGIGASRLKDKDGADEFSGAGFGMALDLEYRLSPNIALGFGIYSLGRAEDSFGGVDTEIEARGYELFGRAIYPVSDTLEIYGRVGGAVYFVDIDPGTVSLEEALFGDDALELGVGVDFGRKEKLAFRLEGRYLNGGDDETGALMFVGFNYLF
ncbi:MAG: outer membrane beta-barrel protein [Woeseiaceae bacterium]|nr:outer membrane beta-barrel protein [Woeseiaceae bacterium]